MSSRRGPMLLVIALAVAVGVGIVLTTRVEPVPPFDIDSARPDGLKAVRVLLEEQGVDVRRSPAARITDGSLELGADEAIVMIAPSAATDEEVAALTTAAAAGGLVVFGEPLLSADEDVDVSVLDDAQFLDGRTLADVSPFEVAPGRCDIEVLADLGDIDTAFATPILPVEGDPERCYDEDGGAHFLRRDEGSGSVVTLSSPYLWVNARLQPRKEEGGEPLANGATAVRLLGGAQRVTFIDPVASAGEVASGTQGPITLLPLPVKLALAQLLGAFVLFVWWRSRRLGPPVAERLPVEAAGSELVAAVGDLLRRRGNPQRAAATVRLDTRRVLAERLGMGADPSPVALVEVVASRTGRPPDEVGAALYDDPTAPIASADSLVALVRTLDVIRQEVLHVAIR